MTNICNFTGIYFKSPLDRFIWEAFCGRGGLSWAIIAILIITIIIIMKAWIDK